MNKLHRLFELHRILTGATVAIDVLERDDLPFPRSLPEFQRLFPNEAAGDVTTLTYAELYAAKLQTHYI